MKANEAPEKVYLSQERDEDGCYVDLMWHKHPYEDRENILYVRTDAFIEKAAEWLRNNLQGIVGGDIYIEDFVKFLKGE